MKKISSAGQGVVEYALLIVLVAIVVIPVLATLNPAIGRTFRNIVDGVVNNDIRSLGIRLTQTVIAATRSSTPTLTPVGYVGPTSTFTPSPTATNTPAFTPTFTNTPTITQTFTATPAGGWIFCANENGTCTFTGTRMVRYGANSTWITKTLTTTPCTNAVFTDPLYGTAKFCWYFDTTIYPTPTPSFTPTPLPTILSITPNTGTTLGNSSVTISGNSFLAGGTTITFGGAAATGVTCTTTSCTLTTPAHAAGAVDVIVTVGSYPVTAVGGYTYVTPPVITGISPNTGTVAGGTVITISGSGFSTTASDNNFAFSGTPFTPTSCTATSCTATTPAHTAGAMNVTDTVSGLSYTLNNAFTYMAPSVTGVSPNFGPLTGGTSVTITGSYFVNGSTSFTFAGAAATSVNCTSTTSCTANTPAGTAGAANVIATVNSESGATLTGGFTYYGAPAITALSPNSGSPAGGTTVTITGTGFSTTATTFTFGGTAATGVSCSSTTSCTALAPAHAAGLNFDVIATANGQTSAISAADKFNFVLTCSKTWSSVPSGKGNYYVITTTAVGDITASWTTSSGNKGIVALYTGALPANFVSNPENVNPNNPPPTPLVRFPTSGSQSGTLNVTATNQIAGSYIVYFFAKDAQTSSTGTFTFLGATCP